MTSDQHVRRIATQRAPNTRSESKPLDEWRELDAYVLLGEPGSGKTTAFRTEALAMGSDAMYITARDLFAYTRPPGWKGETLFIDALDERRKVNSAPTEPLDELRGILNNLGSPRFRLSCREADWPASGLEDLAKVSPSAAVRALWLEPLSQDDTARLLCQQLTEGATRIFLSEAERRGLGFMLSNPLLLGLLVDAVHRNTWPDGRQSTYELACSQMAREYDRQRLGHPSHVTVQKLLDAAGLVQAVLLLCDARAISVDPFLTGEGIIAMHELDRLDIDTSTLRHVMDSKLFVSDGALRTPRHRTIAEYLAARSVGRLVDTLGLPIARVWSLVTGADGRPADVLRGVQAWLSVHCLDARRDCIAQDPVGTISHGDVQLFTVKEKVAILESLNAEADRYRWFRAHDRETTAFAALGTPDMEPTFVGWLNDPSREPGHQVVLGCIFDAIEHGGPFVGLNHALKRIVRDPTYWDHVRSAGLRAWVSAFPNDAPEALALLVDVARGDVKDTDDELAGQLLTTLYPQHLSPAEALDHLRPSKRENWFGSYKNFWNLEFLAATPACSLPDVADLLARRATALTSSDDDADDVPTAQSARELAVHAAHLALEGTDVEVTVERVAAWLAAGFDQYGNRSVSTRHAEAIGSWLTDRPDTMKKVYRHALQCGAHSAAPDGRSYWQAEQFLYHAQVPPDWHAWLLDMASKACDEHLARFCLHNATHAALNPSSTRSIKLEEVETWVAANEHRWPNANAWKLEIALWPLDHWAAKQHERRQRSNAARQDTRGARHSWIAPHWSRICAGTAAPKLYGDIAFAYLNRFSDIHGPTPLERVADYLAADTELAKKALVGLKLVLQRADLPSVDEIFEQTDKRFHFSHAALLAADLVHEGDPAACETWDETLQQTLLAFLFKDTHGSVPDWYGALARSRPNVVGPLLLKFHVPQLRGSAHPSAAFLHHLVGKPTFRELAQWVLPTLMQALPREPNEELLHLLDRTLLPACAFHLSTERFQLLVKDRLASSDISLAWRASLLAAAMTFDPVHSATEIDTFCAERVEAAQMVSRAIKGQGLVDGATSAKSPSAIGCLAQTLARSAAPPDADDLSYLFGDSVHGVAVRLIRLLGSDTAAAAGVELRRLRSEPSLSHWSVEIDAQLYQHDHLARNSSFAAPQARAVINTLANQSPANARDMAELVRAHLSRVADEIQFTEFNLRDHFYRDPATVRGRGRSTGCKPVPKIENDCRDMLLSLLRTRLLAQGVQLEKEAYAAGDRRGDFRASTVIDGRRVIVPAEVKKDDHPALWVAWREQLERQYISDPDTQGIGMYVVLWFGIGTTAAPDGTKPRSAKQGAEMLTAMIPHQWRARIVGLVLDLSLDLR